MHGVEFSRNNPLASLNGKTCLEFRNGGNSFAVKIVTEPGQMRDEIEAVKMLMELIDTPKEKIDEAAKGYLDRLPQRANQNYTHFIVYREGETVGVLSGDVILDMPYPQFNIRNAFIKENMRSRGLAEMVMAEMGRMTANVLTNLGMEEDVGLLGACSTKKQASGGESHFLNRVASDAKRYGDINIRHSHTAGNGSKFYTTGSMKTIEMNKRMKKIQNEVASVKGYEIRNRMKRKTIAEMQGLSYKSKGFAKKEKSREEESKGFESTRL